MPYLGSRFVFIDTPSINDFEDDPWKYTFAFDYCSSDDSSYPAFPMVQMNIFNGKKICAKRIANNNYLSMDNSTGTKVCNAG